MYCFILDVGLGGRGAILVLGIRSLIIAPKTVKVPASGGGHVCVFLQSVRIWEAGCDSHLLFSSASCPMVDPMEWGELCNVSIIVVLFYLGGLVQEKVCGIISFMSVTRSH